MEGVFYSRFCMSRWNISLGTIPILRQHFFGLFLTPAPTHYVSINPVLNVSKNGHFPNLPTQSFCWRNIRMVPYVVAKKLISWQVVLFLFLPFHNGTKIFFNFLEPLQNTARSRDMLSQGVRTHLTDTWFSIRSKDFWDMYRVSQSELTKVNWVWKIELCKLDFGWKEF